MSTINRYQLRPEYPAFAEHQYKPKQAKFGPPDLWPSGLNSGYSVYSGAYGRHLAGVDMQNAESIETYPNELDLLAEADDVAGNGLFDPNNTHGNVHPDAGVFADHQSLPGYVDREVFYRPSEVQDIPGGGNVMYVPGGAVAFQQGQPETLRKTQLLWQIPPSIQPRTIDYVPRHLTVNAPTSAQSIGEINLTDSQKKGLLVSAVAGIGLGLAFYTWMRNQKK